MNKEKIKLSLEGDKLLENREYNKGTAFTRAERENFKLTGKLPRRIETIEEQVHRAYLQFKRKQDTLEKNLFLNQIYTSNTTLFFKIIEQHLEEMLPIIYTPTISEAVKNFSKTFLNSPGLIISYPEREKTSEILAGIQADSLDIAVVTDGEGVLGIGDQGIGGLSIAVGKLMVYTTCGGINPFKTLPIQLDVGTNNEKLLNDPDYLGWRHNRISDKEYYDFLDHFVDCFSKRFPRCFLHWEDFGKNNAHKVLARYRQVHQSFNDDIQGTGAIATAAVLSGIKKSGVSSDRHKFCIFGAGTAGVGIAEQIIYALAEIENKRIEEIRERFYLIDRYGLIREGQQRTRDYQLPYLKTLDQLRGWTCTTQGEYSLEDVTKNAGITILIGCSTASNAFNKNVLKLMANNIDKPIIMPLSNPTSKAEATPEAILKATDGRALIATGSPFKAVKFSNRTNRISQCNNALIFPGLALG
ncbi:MAG: oxaloacetate-decarboxylating malate dehydrogenase, partial [Candidatus Rifleibacteriota bacterium]